MIKEQFEITPTKSTPHVVLNPATEVFAITGKSFPENAKEFYLPIIDWLETFKLEENKELAFNFYLYYVSSSSIISILEIIRLLDDKFKQGSSINIIWNYDADDDDIKKTGEDYSKITKMPFNFMANPL